MFPIRDGQGRVLAFGGRVLDQRLPKYINSPESPLYSKSRNVYGLYEARAAIASADRAIVVEGYLDAIAVWQAGFKETVASLGTALTVDQLRLVGRQTRNVLACFDGDAAGRKASLRALEIFLAAGLLGRGIFIPPGFDPDTFIKQRGAQAFAELIESADLLVDYFLAEQAAAARGSLEGRARAASAVAEVLKAVSNAFEFDLLARKAADALGVGEEVLRAEARRPARGAAYGGATRGQARRRGRRRRPRPERVTARRPPKSACSPSRCCIPSCAAKSPRTSRCSRTRPLPRRSAKSARQMSRRRRLKCASPSGSTTPSARA